MFFKNKINKIKIINYINENIKIKDIYIFKTIDSTNNFSKTIYLNNNNEYSIVVSNSQTSGRGRLNRNFYSPKNCGIYLSIVFKNNNLCFNPVDYTTIAAVAVLKTFQTYVNDKIYIKWVNDLLINNKKFCGILTEATTNPDTNTIDNIIIGIGINVYKTKFPNELENIATSLNLKNISKNLLISEIINNIDYFIKNNDKNEYLKIYKENSIIIGKDVYYSLNDQIYYCKVLDINDNCELIVQMDDGLIKTIRTGEISIRLKK